jgi:hypothetical protein
MHSAICKGVLKVGPGEAQKDLNSESTHTHAHTHKCASTRAHPSRENNASSSAACRAPAVQRSAVVPRDCTWPSITVLGRTRARRPVHACIAVRSVRAVVPREIKNH